MAKIEELQHRLAKAEEKTQEVSDAYHYYQEKSKALEQQVVEMNFEQKIRTSGIYADTGTTRKLLIPFTHIEHLLISYPPSECHVIHATT